MNRRPHLFSRHIYFVLSFMIFLSFHLVFLNPILATNSKELQITSLEPQPIPTVVPGPTPIQNYPPVLQPIPSQQVYEKQLLSFQVTATDQNAGDILRITTSRLPRGASFVDNGNCTGTFTWIPDYDQAGTYNKSIYFKVTDGISSDTKYAYITVYNVNRPPVLGPIGNKSVNEEARLTFQVSATDPDSRDIIVMSATNLPTGATFVDQGGGIGVFDWTPARGRAGNYTKITFIAANTGSKLSDYASDSETISISVVDITPPVISNIVISQFGPNFVTVNWITDDLASSQADYGTTSGYGLTTPLNTSLAMSHSVKLPELTWATQYHYRVRSHNTAFLSTESTDQVLNTSARTRSVVTISGRQLIVQKRNLNGSLSPAEPYIMRGVDWSPASINTIGDNSVRRAEFQKWFQTDIPLMQAMNVNTVRTFMDLGYDSQLGPAGIAILDEFYKRGIMVVMTVDDGSANLTRIDGAVNYYKNHPAILLWSQGSEWSINLYFGLAYSLVNAADMTQTALLRIKSRDSLHPVVTSYGNVLGNVYSDGQTPDFEMLEYFVNVKCPAADIWSFNEYRGRGFSYLFDRWKFVSGKPMFLGEYGIDAYDSIIHSVNQTAQAEWDSALWNEIARNLSAKNSANTGLGGFVFEWNDEWWKTSPAGQQDTGGWNPPGFPDGYASEDYWGIVDINRNPRQVYFALAQGFDPAFEPAPALNVRTLKAYSAGANAAPSVAEFYENGIKFYSDQGFSYNGGRGINVAAIDPTTGHLLTQIKNFDTWLYGSTGEAHYAMINYLDSLPSGAIILFSVADTGGICTTCTQDWYVRSTAKLRELGSTLIDQYVFRGSWAMATVKGESVARSEGISPDHAATAEVTVTLP